MLQCWLLPVGSLPRPAAAFSTHPGAASTQSGRWCWDRAVMRCSVCLLGSGPCTPLGAAGTQQISECQSSNPGRNLRSHQFLFVSSVSLLRELLIQRKQSSARCWSVFLHPGLLKQAAEAPYRAAGLAAVRGAAAAGPAVSSPARLVPRARSACWINREDAVLIKAMHLDNTQF